MATDIFNSSTNYGASWKLDGAIMGFTTSNGAMVDLILQSVNFSYKRPVNRLLSLTSDKQYFVAGRGLGQLQLGAIMGPNDAMTQFITQFSNPCEVQKNNITITPSGTYCNGAKNTAKFVLSYVLLDNVGAQVQIGELAYITETVTGIFGGLGLD